MKTIMLVIAIAVLLPTGHATAQVTDSAARGVLGMSESEAREKYGKPIIEGKHPAAEKTLTFEKDGIYIITDFLAGKVARVNYVRKDQRPFQRAEAEMLLKNNTALRWVYIGDPGDGQQWDTADRSTIAINDTTKSQLSISTRVFISASQAASKAALRGL